MVPRPTRTKLILLFGLILFILIYWFIPISGQVLLVPDNWHQANAWPQVSINSEALLPGQEATLVIFDTVPWTHIKLVVADTEGMLNDYDIDNTARVYEWNWSFTVPNNPDYRLDFYHSCHTGCQAWTTVTTGSTIASVEDVSSSLELSPTKLGVVFANPTRNWHNRRGWDVELTYAQLAETDYWGIDDLARRVKAATDNGLLVLVRVDYNQGQSIPPANDYLALDIYLNYIRRLARDDRFKDVYGYIIGSSFNTSGNNAQAPENMVTPAWYARVFNGYDAPSEHADNVVQTMRAENPAVRILVGSVAPWRDDQDGDLTYRIDTPWLNYFNTLVAAINQATQAKAAVGITLAAPDGFAVQASGRPDAPELADNEQADEPRVDLRRLSWHGAQAGFRVYQDWLDVINDYPHTKGLPIYITSTNTFQPDTGVEPAQNYPPGWLTAALEVVNQEPQIAALCWFLDEFPHDDQWDFFSLTDPRGLMVNAADEFDFLLRSVP